MANPGLGVGNSPTPTPTPMPTPAVAGVTGAARAATVSKAGGVAAAGALPDFASDLARLVAVLGAGRPGVAVPGADDGSADAIAETVGSLETGDSVDALCAEVALAVPGPAPTVAASPLSEAAAVAAPTSTSSEVAPGQTDGRRPSRTLQVLLTPPGSAQAAEHRSAQAPDAPTLPTLPLLPAAAAGAAAFTLAPDTTADAPVLGAVTGASSAEGAAAVPVGAAFPLDAALRPAHAPSAPHALAGTIVDTLQPQASRQLAETVSWHVPAQGAAEVQIRLNPEELGPLEVQLKLEGDKVSVRFDLADERVRDLVQTSLPNLSSLLASRGLQLDQAQVFAQQREQGSPQQQQAPSQAPWSSARHDADDADATLSTGAAMRPMMRRGLLDDYA